MYLSVDAGRVEALRHERGISRKVLAYQANVSLSAVRRIERTHTLHRPETVRKVARVLGVDPRSLACPARTPRLRVIVGGRVERVRVA